MIRVYDNFLTPDKLKGVTKKVKTLDFYNDIEHPQSKRLKILSHTQEVPDLHFPGIRSEAFLDIAPTTHRIISKAFEQLNDKFYWINRFNMNCYAHLKLKDDFCEDNIHQDECNFAFLLYLSETNLNSGTKFYFSVDDDKENDNCSVKFVQNRFVVFDSKIPHTAYGHYGTDLSNGRLSINGFCEYI